MYFVKELTLLEEIQLPFKCKEKCDFSSFWKKNIRKKCEFQTLENTSSSGKHSDQFIF